MKGKRRVVVRLPLDELWTDDGVIESDRLRDLERDDVAGLLRAGPVRFVVANPGDRLKWVAEAECFVFWKSAVTQRLFDPRDEIFDLDRMPGSYGYLATEWSAVSGVRIVLLEMQH